MYFCSWRALSGLRYLLLIVAPHVDVEVISTSTLIGSLLLTRASCFRFPHKMQFLNVVWRPRSVSTRFMPSLLCGVDESQMPAFRLVESMSQGGSVVIVWNAVKDIPVCNAALL
jgi:hypothetical protein